MISVEKTTLSAHPAAELFPLMSDAELIELAEDIKKNGLLEPITLHEGKVLDGRNRLVACELAGMPPTFQDWGGLGELPTRYVIAKNLQRRQLSTGQRAAIAASAVPLLKEEAHQRQLNCLKRGTSAPSGSVETNGEQLGRASEIAAKQVGVSRASVERAMHVKEASPEEFGKLMNGETEVRTALRAAQESGRPYQFKVERIQQITDMAAQGYNSEQIGDALGVEGLYVRTFARKHAIALPEFDSRSRRKIDVTRIVRETVFGAESLIVGLDMVEGKMNQVTSESINQWIASLDTSVKALSGLLRQLKKRAGNDN